MAFHQPDKICPVCQIASQHKFLQDFESQNGKFSLFECSLCNIQFWLPFKNPGAMWYEKDNNYNVKESSSPRQIHSYHKKFLELHKKNMADINVLDLGCGTGEFMAELEKKNINVWGTDSDKEAIKIARKNFALKNIHDLSIENFFQTVEAPGFDYITIFETIEHIDNPLAILLESKKILKADGKLVLSTPSRDRLFRNLSGWDYPLHHLSRWNKKSATNILRLAGYKNIKIIYLNKFSQLYELFLEILSKKLGFKKAIGLKKLSKERVSINNKKELIRRWMLKNIYKTGRFIGVIVIPYFIAILFFPLSFLFFPRAGVMYIECSN